jgi:cell division control protein 24
MRDDDTANGYPNNGRNIKRPSYPETIGGPSSQHSVTPSRLRSASSPDFQNGNGQPRHYINGQLQPGGEEIPVPPIPSHIVSMRGPVNRSQNNSPTDSQRGVRTATKSPAMRTPAGFGPSYGYEPSDSRFSQPPNHMSSMGQRIMSPSLPPTSADQAPYVSQLKVKIWFEPRPSHVTIVVPIIIKHRSLIDRIDSKMEKVTMSSIAKGTARLRYLDSEDELITIKNDEDVQLAIEEWVINNEADLRAGTIPDFELYWHEIP